jgi:hypothetical protein
MFYNASRPESSRAADVNALVTPAEAGQQFIADRTGKRGDLVDRQVLTE